MNYTDIHYPDIADGPGCRVSVFVSGCDLHCPGCFNEVAWDFDSGDPLDDEIEQHIMELLEKPWIAGLTVLGGEPMHPHNTTGVLHLCRLAKQRCPDKDVWVYSGHTLERLEDMAADDPALDEMLYAPDSPVDVIVDGPFIEALKNVTLRFRGSSNQVIRDMHLFRELNKTPL